MSYPYRMFSIKKDGLIGYLETTGYSYEQTSDSLWVGTAKMGGKNGAGYNYSIAVMDSNFTVLNIFSETKNRQFKRLSKWLLNEVRELRNKQISNFTLLESTGKSCLILP
jgi:hypothetical protein